MVNGMLSILSIPYILPTSSIKSTEIFISVLLEGTITFNVLSLLIVKPSLVNISFTSSSDIFIPKTLFIFSRLISISLS